MTVKKGRATEKETRSPPSLPPHPPQNSAKSMRDEGRQRLGIRFKERKKGNSIKIWRKPAMKKHRLIRIHNNGEQGWTSTVSVSGSITFGP